MPTQITAVLDRATLEQLLSELTPLKVMLGGAGAPDRHFTIDRPDLVQFVPGKGVRLRTRAHAQWTLAGLPIPLTIESATLLLEPAIAPPPHPGKLVFTLKIEQLDVKNVPSVIESKLVPLINEGLSALEEPLGWNFAKTLNVHIAIPPQAAPLEAFTLAAGASTVEVTADAIVMKLQLWMHFERLGVKLATPMIDTPTVDVPTNTPAKGSS